MPAVDAIGATGRGCKKSRCLWEDMNGWRVVGAVVYMVVAAVVSLLLARALREELPTGGHESAIRACIVPPDPRLSLDDIGGLARAKEDLRRVVLLPLKHPRVFYNGPSALRPPRGVLLHGPPGTGKTMLARALAAESGVPFVALTSAALESKWFGESSKLLSATFRLARDELQPCILFFDEIDGMGRARSDQDQSCVYSFKTELLRNLDGVEGGDGAAVVVLACTNCPHALDPALRRRFPRVIHVDRPDEAARLDILRRLLRDEIEVDDASLRAVAKRCVNHTGADLAALVAAATAKRLDGQTVEDMLDDGRVTSGAQLLRHMGPLTEEHFRT